jgi:Ran GTPase-activating protein (RanGAP) involved in mRNA processing and transport
MQNLYMSLDPDSEIIGHIDMYIGYNEITGVGASYIAEALRTTRALRKLDLDRNTIGDKGLQYIAEVLATNTTLTDHELSLRECGLSFTEESGPALTEMLRRNKSLRELDLSFNKAISDNAASFIIEGLKKNTTLKTLDLNYCGLTCEGCRLIQSITSTCKIQHHYMQFPK